MLNTTFNGGIICYQWLMPFSIILKQNKNLLHRLLLCCAVLLPSNIIHALALHEALGAVDFLQCLTQIGHL